jgi:hypothetical protein
MNVERPFPWTSETADIVRTLLGILNQALGDMASSLKAMKRTGQPFEFPQVLMYIESGRWLLSDSERPFSSRWCVEHLGYDHDRFRRQLIRNWREIMTQKKWRSSEKSALAVLEGEDEDDAEEE